MSRFISPSCAALDGRSKPGAFARVVLALAAIASLLALFPSEAQAQTAILQQSTNAGASWSDAGITYCAAGNEEFRTEFNNCPAGINIPGGCNPSGTCFIYANPYRMTATLYRSGAVVQTMQSTSNQAAWNFYFNTTALQPGTYYSTVKTESHGCFGWNTDSITTSDAIEVTDIANSCSIGWFDGANCQMGTAPAGSQGFVYNGELYYDALLAPNDCPLAGSSWDGAHCFVPHPAGTSAFLYDNNLYYTYAAGSNPCPQTGSSNDGAHCFVPTPWGATNFLYSGNLYYYMNSCPVAGSSWDGAHCKMPNVPAGSTPFVWQNVNLDYTPACH